jgi:voltage-gated sodium channel
VAPQGDEPRSGHGGGELQAAEDVRVPEVAGDASPEDVADALVEDEFRRHPGVDASGNEGEGMLAGGGLRDRSGEIALEHLAGHEAPVAGPFTARKSGGLGFSFSKRPSRDSFLHSRPKGGAVRTISGIDAEDTRRITPRQTGSLGRAQAWLESAGFQNTITALIVLNAVTLGLETSRTAMETVGPALLVVDRVLLSIFVLELAAKLVVYRTRFHRDPWNVFDFVVIGLALLPTTGSLAVLRGLRVLRALRLISAVPSMRRVVGALLHAVPGMGSIVALLGVIFYVFSVMATKLFGPDFPDWFGTLGASAYTLFQIMTLESWSMGIVRPVMAEHPWAWAFFVPFIVATAFTVLNLFIGIIVDAMHSQHDTEQQAEREALDAAERRGVDDRAAILAELVALRRELAALRFRNDSERA